MLGKEMLEQVMKFSRKPALFENGTGSIWTDPYLEDQMLNCHLDLNSDAASRNEKQIQKTEGVFIFDVTTPNCHEKMIGTHNWYAADGGFWRKGKHVV